MKVKYKNFIFLGLVILSVAIIIYALGFSSNVAFANTKNGLSRESDLIKFNEEYVQPANNFVFVIGIVLILLMISCYIFNSTKRQNYYFSNYITTGLVGVGLLVFSIINLIHVTDLIKRYDVLLEKHLIIGPNGELSGELADLMTRVGLIPTKGIYYIGIVLSVLSLLAVVGLGFFLYFQFTKERKYLKERNEFLTNYYLEVEQEGLEGEANAN